MGSRAIKRVEQSTVCTKELDMCVKGEEVVRMLLGFLTSCYWKVSFTEIGNTGKRSVWEEMGR